MGTGSPPKQPSASLLSRFRAPSRPRARLPQNSVAQTTEQVRTLQSPVPQAQVRGTDRGDERRLASQIGPEQRER